MMNYFWCNTCRDRHDNFKLIKTEKGKKGLYYPYRDTMEAEHYTYTELTYECLFCGATTEIERDRNECERSLSRMQKFGYRGANYGT